MDNRLTNLRALMKKQKIDAVFVSSVSNIIYLTNFSGFSTEDRDAFLLITQKQKYIFTHGIYKEAVKKHIGTFILIEMSRENPTGKSLKTLITKHHINKLGYEDNDLTVWEFQRLFKQINKKLLNPTSIIAKLREIKSSNEIQEIKKSCALGDKAYSHILKNLRIGMTEKEVAFEIEYFIRKNGEEISFPTIAAFGENASLPHHISTDKKLAKNTFVLMDFGVKLNNYCSDMSRTVFFGKANKEQTNVYQTVLKSQQKAIEFIDKQISKTGKAKAAETDKISREYIISNDYPSIPHSLGHGIGLEVHESPSLSTYSKEKLENGMVFSIEPGIYLPDKFGVRIEDLFAIENNKLIPLTHSPKNLIEI